VSDRPPRLSIGLPVYNGERYVGEAIDSILGQAYGDFELVVSDNASTDGTREICESYARRDPRVRFLRQPVNLGASANFNEVLSRARAPRFKWACADDRLAAGFLESGMREMDACPSVVLCYGQTTMIDDDGRPLGPSPQGLDLREDDVAERFRLARERSGYLNVLQGILRTDVLRETAQFGAYPGADEALVVELTLRGPFHEIEAPMLFRRFHAEAASAGTTLAARQDHLDPSSRGRLSLWHWRHAAEHVKTIGRAPLPLREKARLLGVVAKGMVRQRYQHRRELQDAIAHLARRLKPRL